MRPVQLYDIVADPDETKNLTEANPERVARLTALLRRNVIEGRSTPGVAQLNDTPNDWKLLSWIDGATKFETPPKRAGKKKRT